MNLDRLMEMREDFVEAMNYVGPRGALSANLSLGYV